MSPKDSKNSKENFQNPADVKQDANQVPSDFLTISSIQCIRLLFSVSKNFGPLLDVMKGYSNFDEFVMKCAGKNFEDVIKGS